MSEYMHRWEVGRVDRTAEHFVLSVSDKENNGAVSSIAVVGPPTNGVVSVEYLTARNSSNTASIAKVEREISFYLLELNEPDPWRYAQHHCGTASNIYSDVHWSFSDGSPETSELDDNVESSGPANLQTSSGYVKGAIVHPRFYERDMDIILAEEFRVSQAFATWFLSATDCSDCRTGKVVDVAVSKSDNLGESDLVVLFEAVDSKSRSALFIEDKIDAPVQPDQLARYRKRAEMGRQKGQYSHFHVVLCSPRSYKETHKDADGFDAYISYESIAAFLRRNDPANTRNLYRADMIASAAVRTGSATWVKETDALTDAFWQAAFLIANREFHDLEMKPPKFASGQTWIGFRPQELPTRPRLVYVDLKADKGFADLTFSGILCRLFAPAISTLLDGDMTTHQAGKSTLIRLNFPPFGITKFDSDAEQRVRAAFTACTRLIRFYRDNRLALNSAASESIPEPLAPVFARPSETV